MSEEDILILFVSWLRNKKNIKLYFDDMVLWEVQNKEVEQLVTDFKKDRSIHGSHDENDNS